MPTSINEGVEAEKGTEKRERLPISPMNLKSLKEAWADKDDYDTKSACCLCFTFLRLGEMTVQDNGGYDPSVHLSVQDIILDDSLKPSILRIRIKQSKKVPFRRGVELFVGKTLSLLCPVSAMSVLTIWSQDLYSVFKTASY